MGCANKKCPHCGAGGCKLFEGSAWLMCRKALKDPGKVKAAKKGKGNGKQKG